MTSMKHHKGNRGKEGKFKRLGRCSLYRLRIWTLHKAISLNGRRENYFWYRMINLQVNRWPRWKITRYGHNKKGETFLIFQLFGTQDVCRRIKSSGPEDNWQIHTMCELIKTSSINNKEEVLISETLGITMERKFPWWICCHRIWRICRETFRVCNNIRNGNSCLIF